MKMHSVISSIMRTRLDRLSSSRIISSCLHHHYSSLVSPPPPPPPSCFPPEKLKELYVEFRLCRSKSAKNVIDGYIERMITLYDPEESLSTCMAENHTLLHDQRAHAFQITECPVKEKIILKRELDDGSNIQILVDIHGDASPWLIMDKKINLSLIVDIKRDQDHTVLNCTAPPFQISTEGGKILKLDENIHQYLAKIGIQSSLVDFLREYMAFKCKRDYYTWMAALQIYVVQ